MMASAPTARRASLDASGQQPDSNRRPATANARIRVMVLVSDALLGRAVSGALRADGFEVLTPTTPPDTAVLAPLMAASHPDLVIVELGGSSRWPIEATLDALHGPAWDRSERRVIGVAPPAADGIRIRALLAGADDVVSTPITPGELAARCLAVLRRTDADRRGNGQVAPPPLTFGPLTVDVGRKEIRILGTVVPATRLEYALFEQLCRRPDEVRPRITLLSAVWGSQWRGDTHIVDVHLSNLRRKLQRVAPNLNVIHTVRGIGFRLSDDLITAANHGTDRLSA